MEPLLGQIQIFPFNWAPRGWALCDGALLPIAANQALFSLLGCSFGGNCETNFALPNYGSISPTGSHYFICINSNNFPQR